MPKRLHDSAIWHKRWFRLLKPEEKCAFAYIKDTCDGAGVWDADVETAEHFIGKRVDWDALPDKTHGNIVRLANGKWWLPDFVTFQCSGVIAEDTTNRAHQSYVRQLKKHGLWDDYVQLSTELCTEKGQASPMHGALDNDKEEDKEEDKDKKTARPKAPEKVRYADYVRMTEEEHGKLVAAYGKDATRKAIERLDNYKGAKGKTYKSDYRAILSWVVDALSLQPLVPKTSTTWKCPQCGKTHTSSYRACECGYGR